MFIIYPADNKKRNVGLIPYPEIIDKSIKAASTKFHEYNFDESALNIPYRMLLMEDIIEFNFKAPPFFKITANKLISQNCMHIESINNAIRIICAPLPTEKKLSTRLYIQAQPFNESGRFTEYKQLILVYDITQKFDKLKPEHYPSKEDTEAETKKFRSDYYKRIDSFVLSIPEIASQSVRSLAMHLKEISVDDRELVRAIFTWFNCNFRYELGHDIFSWDDYDKQLAKKKGKCEEYSKLFKAVCLSAGIPAVYISGYVPTGFTGGGYVAPKNEGEPYSRHAWNAVLLDGKWRLLDITWGWFIQNPEVFIKSHYPLEPDPRFQLLKNKVAIKEFFDKWDEETIKANLGNNYKVQ